MALADPFEMLGVTPTASDDEIKQAWRIRIAEVHPDRHAGDEDAANARAAELNGAYALIKTARRRAEFRRAAVRLGGQFDPGGLAASMEHARRVRQRDRVKAGAVAVAGVAAAIYTLRSLRPF